MSDFLIPLSSKGGHLYHQIYNYIKKEIEDGSLTTGERLPSSRALADNLQVSRSTVDTAYSQLLAEGYLISKACKGYYVNEISELFIWEREKKSEVPDKVVKKKEYVADFSPYRMDERLFPYSIWSRLYREVLSSGKNGKGTIDSQGDFALRQVIAHYLRQSRGAECSPDRIILGAGNDYLLMLLNRILGKNRKVAMENPTYLKAYRLFQSFSYEIYPVDMDEEGMSAQGLEESGANLAYIMPSHQFPTGVLMPIKRRLELLRWAEEKGERYLLEDDYDSEFRYRGRPVPALLAKDRNGKVIYLGTFSKSISPDLRISFMVLPEVLMEEYTRTCGYLRPSVSDIDQQVLYKFLEDGNFERHVNRMRKHYREKHSRFLEKLAPFQSYFYITGKDAGLHLLLRSTTGLSEKMLMKKADEKGVRVYGLSEHCYRENFFDNSTVLLGFGGVTEEEMDAGIQKLKEAWLL